MNVQKMALLAMFGEQNYTQLVLRFAVRLSIQELLMLGMEVKFKLESVQEKNSTMVRLVMGSTSSSDERKITIEE
jgi:hypothetical protein